MTRESYTRTILPASSIPKSLAPHVKEGEVFRPAPGYSDTYHVSSLGRVYSVPRAHSRGGFLRRQVATATGYVSVQLTGKGSHRKRFPLHQLVARAFLGDKPKGHVVRHLDGDPGNNCLENIAYGTQQHNQYDAILHGRPGRKLLLTDEQAREVYWRSRHENITFRCLGRQYGVGPGLVSRIHHKNSYVWIHPDWMEDYRLAGAARIK